MSDRLPYEEQLAQQWNDLPLPDENMAWQDMKRRLDEDDDDRIIPFWLSGCGLWGLVALFVIGLGWWLLRPEKWWNKKEGTESVQHTSPKESNIDKSNQVGFDTAQVTNKTDEEKLNEQVNRRSQKDTAVNTQVSLKPDPQKNLPGKDIVSQTTPVSDDPQNKTGRTRRITQTGPAIISKPRNQPKTTNTKDPDIRHKPGEPKKITTDPGNKKQADDDTALFAIQPGGKGNQPRKDSIGANNRAVTRSDSFALAGGNTVKPDSIKVNTTDTTSKKPGDIAKQPDPKKDSAKKKSFSFAAGLGMHQLIPVDGQKLTPYTSTGRKSSLADYIPSVYFRMYRDDKWFVQAEFRYGAPQYIPEFVYDQQVDTSGGFMFTTSTNLKKTFYHQLPVSFNYFVTKDWSIGGGFVWNKFSAAISDQDVLQTNLQTQADSSYSKVVVTSNSTDSNSTFAKSYFQALFETQYRWKRFSFGARYSFGLQPYITFRLPGGEQQQERNKSLQLFIRYELWRSRAK